MPFYKKHLSGFWIGEVNTHNIAKNMGTSHQTIAHYLSILQSVGLIEIIYPFEGGNQYLRKPQKICLQNTTLLYTLNQLTGENLSQGTLREIYFIQTMQDAGEQLYYSKQGDYRTEKTIFEIGEKNKSRKQISDTVEPAFLVKDDILVATEGQLPLLFFGFSY